MTQPLSPENAVDIVERLRGLANLDEYSNSHYDKLHYPLLREAAAEIEQALMMLGDVPGETLNDRLTRLQGWYLEMQILVGDLKHKLGISAPAQRAPVNETSRDWDVCRAVDLYREPRNEGDGRTLSDFLAEHGIALSAVTSTEREPLVFSGKRDPFNSIVDWAKEQASPVTSTVQQPVEKTQGGAWRKISTEDAAKRQANGANNVDWIEGVGYVVYDAQALAETREQAARIAAVTRPDGNTP